MKKIISFASCLVILLSSLLIPVSAYTAEIVKMPDKTVFYEGLDWTYYESKIVPLTDFDLTGTIIKHNGNDISFHKFPWGGNMLAEPVSGKWQLGKNNVKFVLEDFGNAYATGELTLVAIKKIELKKSPDKTTLVHGTDWDYDALGYIALKTYSPSGAKIKVTYTDGTTAVISYSDGGMDWFVPDEIENFNLGNNNLTLTYHGFSVPFTVKFVLEEVKSIELKRKPTKQTYDFDSDWSYSKSGKIVPDIDLEGMSVTVTYTNGNSETVSYTDNRNRFSFKLPETVTLGNNKIKVSVDGTNTVEFDILIRGYGDINFDGQVNSNDALSVLQYSVNLIRFNLVKFNYADVSDDGVVNSSDALAILQKAVGKIDYFKAELA